MHKVLRYKRLGEEPGSALIVSVLVLVALTIMGLSLVTSSNLLIDVSGNIKAQASAYQAAESCMYYQIKRIQQVGTATDELNYDLGNGTNCNASEPDFLGAGSGSSALLFAGFSMESGSTGFAYQTFSFNVSGAGDRKTQHDMKVIIRVPTNVTGY